MSVEICDTDPRGKEEEEDDERKELEADAAVDELAEGEAEEAEVAAVREATWGVERRAAKEAVEDRRILLAAAREVSPRRKGETMLLGSTLARRCAAVEGALGVVSMIGPVDGKAPALLRFSNDCRHCRVVAG